MTSKEEREKVFEDFRTYQSNFWYRLIGDALSTDVNAETIGPVAERYVQMIHTFWDGFVEDKPIHESQL